MVLDRIGSAMLGFMFTTLGWAASPGDQAPTFDLATLQDATGNREHVASKEYQGEVILVDFWASWCPPCRESFPLLDAVGEKYRGAGFHVIGINVDNDQKDAREFIVKHKVSFDLAWDQGGAVASEYQVRAMPTSYLIDKSGKIRFVHYGFYASQMAQVEKEIAELLKE